MSQVDSVDPGWRRSSRCDHNACVEVARFGAMVAVRDNTQPDQRLTFERESWAGLLRALRSGKIHR